MKKDAQKILDALSENFAEDPRALFAAFRFVVKKFSGFESLIESSRADEHKESKKELDSAVGKIQEAIRDRNIAILETVDKMIATSSKEIMRAIAKEDTSKEWRKEIDKLVKKLDTEFRQRLTTVEGRSERSSPGFAIGGPGRSVYFNGVYPDYYSDLNFIGAFTATPNEQTQRIDVTFSGSGGGGSGSAVSLQLPASGLVNSVNRVFTYVGLVSMVVVDGDIDVDAVISYSNGVSTITTSVPPQYSLNLITGNYLILQIPSQAVNSSNRTYTFNGQAWLAVVDGKVDTSAAFSYNAATGVTTVTTSVPPQNSVLLVGGGGGNPQPVMGTINGVNTIFTAQGMVGVAIVDNDVDIGAVLTYNAGTATTEIVYSVPPQNNAYAF